MKLAILPALCIIGNSFAAPVRIQARDLTVMNYNMKRVQDAINILTPVLTRKPGGNDQQQWVQYFQAGLQANQQITAELFTGASEIKRGPSVNDIESLGLNGPATGLLNSLNKAMTLWIGVKRQAAAVGAQNAILNELTQAESGSAAFVDAIGSKCGVFSQVLVSGYKSSFASAMGKAVNEYRRL